MEKIGRKPLGDLLNQMSSRCLREDWAGDGGDGDSALVWAYQKTPNKTRTHRTEECGTSAVFEQRWLYMQACTEHAHVPANGFKNKN